MITRVRIYRVRNLTFFSSYNFQPLRVPLEFFLNRSQFFFIFQRALHVFRGPPPRPLKNPRSTLILPSNDSTVLRPMLFPSPNADFFPVFHFCPSDPPLNFFAVPHRIAFHPFSFFSWVISLYPPLYPDRSFSQDPSMRPLHSVNRSGSPSAARITTTEGPDPVPLLDPPASPSRGLSPRSTPHNFCSPPSCNRRFIYLPLPTPNRSLFQLPFLLKTTSKTTTNPGSPTDSPPRQFFLPLLDAGRPYI